MSSDQVLATVRRIVDGVSEEFRAHGVNDTEIAMSVVGMLSFVDPQTPEDRKFAETAIPKLSVQEFTGFMQLQWKIFLNQRPDLVNRAWPLAEPWLSEARPVSKEKLRGAKAIADTAVKRGMFSLAPHRQDIDVLGECLMAVRGTKALQARGQFLTPSSLAAVTAQMVQLEENQSILDPAVGTGGLLRAAAHSMRARGLKPSTVHWEGVDTDYVAIACLSLNVTLWGLGHDVLIGVGNGLSDEWRTRAAGERRETIELARSVRRMRLLESLIENPGQKAEPNPEPLSVHGDRVDSEPDLSIFDDPDSNDVDLSLFDAPEHVERPRRGLVVNRRRGKVERVAESTLELFSPSPADRDPGHLF